MGLMITKKSKNINFSNEVGCMSGRKRPGIDLKRMLAGKPLCCETPSKHDNVFLSECYWSKSGSIYRRPIKNGYIILHYRLPLTIGRSVNDAQIYQTVL